jgi:putative Ca2+/H+ antiporter (TMEM165/GDT1 family)
MSLAISCRRLIFFIGVFTCCAIVMLLIIDLTSSVNMVPKILALLAIILFLISGISLVVAWRLTKKAENAEKENI